MMNIARRTRLRLVLAAGLCGCIAASGALAQPTVQSWTTPNGVRVLFAHTPEPPILDVRVVFDAGSARDGDHPGLARLTNALLDQGAGKWSADAIAARFARVGARFSNGVDRDRGWVALRTLAESRYREPALATLAQALAAPAFRTTAFQRERARLEVAARERREQPGALATDAFYRALYREHPYAHPPAGSPESVAAIEHADVVAFHRNHYVGANAVIAVVGPLARGEAQAIARRVVQDLPQGEPAPDLPEASAPDAPGTVRVPRAGAQAHIVLGQLGIAPQSDERFPLYVANHALGGGGLTSRLAEAVRVQRGLAYSVYSTFQPLARRGPFEMRAQTALAQADSTREVMLRTLERFLEKGPTEEEIALAKSDLAGGFPLRIDSNAELVAQLAVMGFYGLPADHLQSFPKRIEAVDAQQAYAAFRTHVDPSRLITVVVGAPSSGSP